MDLQILNLNNYHAKLLKEVNDNYPTIKKATENFNKSQSQFMDNMLTISQLTPARSARQCLAEIKKIRTAIEEAFFKVKKNEIIIKKHENLKVHQSNKLDKDLISIEIQELQTQNENIKDNVNGAVRKMSNFMAQYKNILKRLGKEEFTEEDFEKDEERYHIMKAFEQGLNAARSRNGIIDEGNLIYLFQIGVSGGAAQIEVKNFFEDENRYLLRGEMPPHEIIIEWLEEMADKYCGSAKKFAEYKGLELIDKKSLLTRG